MCSQNFTLMWCTSEQNQSCQKKQRVAHSKPQLGSYFKSTSLCPAESGEIGPMFTALPLKLAFRRKCEDRDACSNGIAVSLGGSRYRDETRVECMFQWSVRTRRVWKNLPWTWRPGKFYALIVQLLWKMNHYTIKILFDVYCHVLETWFFRLAQTRQISHSPWDRWNGFWYIYLQENHKKSTISCR